MRKQTLVSSLTTRLCLKESALGRMPIFTRRSRASTFQIICARLSKMDPWLLSPRTLLFLDTLRPRDTVGSEDVGHDLGSHAGNSIGLLANTGLFLSTGNRYLFLFQSRFIPFDSLPLHLNQFSRAKRQSLFTMVFNF